MTNANDDATFKVLSLGRLVDIAPRPKAPAPVTLEVVERKSKTLAPVTLEVVERKSKQRPASIRLYTSTDEMLADPAGRKRLLAEALNQLVAWRKRFGCLTDLDSLAREVDRTVDELSR